jgi:hypothetical protein
MNEAREYIPYDTSKISRARIVPPSAHKYDGLFLDRRRKATFKVSEVRQHDGNYRVIDMISTDQSKYQQFSEGYFRELLRSGELQRIQ